MTKGYRSTDSHGSVRVIRLRRVVTAATNSEVKFLGAKWAEFFGPDVPNPYGNFTGPPEPKPVPPYAGPWSGRLTHDGRPAAWDTFAWRPEPIRSAEDLDLAAHVDFLTTALAGQGFMTIHNPNAHLSLAALGRELDTVRTPVAQHQLPSPSPDALVPGIDNPTDARKLRSMRDARHNAGSHLQDAPTGHVGIAGGVTPIGNVLSVVIIDGGAARAASEHIWRGPLRPYLLESPYGKNPELDPVADPKGLIMSMTVAFLTARDLADRQGVYERLQAAGLVPEPSNIREAPFTTVLRERHMLVDPTTGEPHTDAAAFENDELPYQWRSLPEELIRLQGDPLSTEPASPGLI
jgi:hypothetical protein